MELAIVIKEDDIADLARTPIINESAGRAIASTDHGRIIRFSGSSPANFTFNPASSPELYGVPVTFRNQGAADITLVADGVTINPASGGTLVLETGMAVTAMYSAAGVWDLYGQTKAAGA